LVPENISEEVSITWINGEISDVNEDDEIVLVNEHAQSHCPICSSRNEKAF
jgi:hypothetical protein